MWKRALTALDLHNNLNSGIHLDLHVWLLSWCLLACADSGVLHLHARLLTWDPKSSALTIGTSLSDCTISDTS